MVAANRRGKVTINTALELKEQNFKEVRQLPSERTMSTLVTR